MYYLLILAVAATRLLPHPPNVACIGALGLFAGCYLTGRRAYLVPLAALLLSDVLGHALAIPGMGFYSLATMAMVYAGVLAAVPVGRFMSKHQGLLKYPLGALAASTLFFAISNFGVWIGPWYPTNLAGLLACYSNAIPFYGYTVEGDMLFTFAMFGSWEVSRRGINSRRQLARAV